MPVWADAAPVAAERPAPVRDAAARDFGAPPSPPGFAAVSAAGSGSPAARSSTRVPGKVSEIDLVPGFNLASLPNQPPDPDPGAVLAPIAGQFSAVFSYDACDPADPWKLFDPNDPAASDLTVIDHTLGLWIDAAAPLVLPSPGSRPPVTEIQLCTGWNLIGYPLAQARPVPAALASIAGKYLRVFGFERGDAADPWEVFDVAAPFWANDLQLMRPGRGYWVLVTEDVLLRYANDGPAPFVEIAAPADLDEMTAPTPVVGTVRSDLLDGWTLSYRPSGENAPFVEIASADVPVENAPLATFDPTMLLNGMYDLRLEAVDFQGRVVETTSTVAVEGKLKLGKFTLTSIDLALPLSGLDVEVIRMYDNRELRLGDFGVGWTLEIRQGTYRNNRKPGDGWQFQSGFLPCEVALATKSHLTTIRLSDDEVYRFALNLTSSGTVLGGCVAEAEFIFVDGPQRGSRLDILGNTTVIFTNGSDEVLDFDTLEVYEPSDVRLTTRDGRIFDLDLDLGVTRLEDRNGNVIDVSATGLSHSSGRSITFERDAQGRISRIVDPAGRALEYAYDAAGDLTAVTDRDGTVTRFFYDGEHGLLRVEDPLGRTPARNEYDEQGRLVRHIDALGNSFEFSPDLDNRRELVTDRLGQTRIIEYDERGNVARETDPTGAVTVRAFDDRDNLLTETDPLGNVTSRSYNAFDDVLSVTDPLGNVEVFTYDSFGDVLTTTDERGGVTSFVYSAAGDLLTETDPEGHVASSTYDPQGNLLTRTDGRGATTAMAYDAFGNLIEMVDPSGNRRLFTYDLLGNRLTATVERTVAGTLSSETTTFVYDEVQRLLSTTSPDGSVRSFEYDDAGQRTAEIDELGRRTAFAYDAAGKLIRTTFPDGTAARRSYDAEDRLLSIEDRDGRIRAVSYDATGRLVGGSLPDGGTATVSYDAAGRSPANSDFNGNTTMREFDADGNVVRLVDALGNETLFGYDPVGQPISVRDALGRTTRYEYDLKGFLTRVIYPDGSEESYAYDPVGQVISHTDRAGRTLTLAYDAASEPLPGNDLLPTRLSAVTDALGNGWSFAYDQAGNRTGQTDPNGNATAWEYDALGRVVRHVRPLGMAATFTYDAAGNQTSSTDFNGDTITFGYDSDDRLIRKTLPDGSQVSWTYTAAGDVATVTDSRGVTSFSYDANGRLARVVDPDGLEISYTYDPQGNRTSVTTPSGTTGYAYDALNRLIEVVDPDGASTTYAYDAVGNLIEQVDPNGVRTAWSYDVADQVVGIEHRLADGTVLLGFDYDLTPGGDVASVTETSGRTVSYAYDAERRLIGETIDDPTTGLETIGYSYDAAGNRLTRSDSAGTSSYGYDANDRLLTAGGVSFGYDANGNVTSRQKGGQTETFAWDFENRLASVTTPAGTATFEYDADGLRVAATRSGVRTRFLVDKNRTHAQVLEERAADGSLLTRYVHGLDLISLEQAGVDRFFHYDRIGSTRALSDAAGTVTDSYAYEAFGELIDSSGSTDNRYLFTGEQFEPASELYYLRARYLDPTIGRFASVDPFEGFIDQPESLPRYTYAFNSPVRFVDPSGEFVGITVGLGAQANARASSASAAIGVLRNVVLRLARSGLQTVRQLKRFRRAGKLGKGWIHHLIEQRLFSANKILKRKFGKSPDGIPGVLLDFKEHVKINAKWRRWFPFKGQKGHRSNIPLDQIIQAALDIYSGNSSWQNAVSRNLLSCLD